MAALLNLNVLVADDEENDLILMRRVLDRLDGVGHFTFVRDGEETLAYLQGEGVYANRTAWPLPGLLILDHYMPRISGIDVLCWVRTEPRLCNLPVLLLTAGLPPSEQQMLAGLQAAYCVKTVGIQESVELIENGMIEALTLARGGWFGRRKVPLSKSAPKPVGDLVGV